MNDGVNTTPEQAARSLRIVRLVSFGASVVLAVLVLLGVAALRYSPLWPEADAPVAVVSEIARASEVQPRAQTPPPAPPPPRAQPNQQITPTPTPEPAPSPTPSAPREPVVITNPVWVERPRNPERFYPREAFMQGVAGEVVLDCEVAESGRLTCVVASETPAGRGFGEAALRIANAHVMRPALRNGVAAPGRYRMVVPFSPGD